MQMRQLEVEVVNLWELNEHHRPCEGHDHSMTLAQVHGVIK